jgi:hypothetical protein
VGTNPVVCTASDGCHNSGTCDPLTGTCVNPVLADGTPCAGTNLCNQTYGCLAGVCTGSNPVTCIAADACHLVGQCQPATGTCSSPPAPDGTACPTGSNHCLTAYACLAGLCTGTGIVTCSATDQCHAPGTCNPATGICSNPAVPDGTACNGSNLCNQTYACVGGNCLGTHPVPCLPTDACRLTGTCDPETGACTNPTAPDGTPCSDGNACTTGDFCSSGTCTSGTPVTCSQTDTCHIAGTCDPTTGRCTNPAIADGTLCNDGNPCTSGDTCTSGICSGSAGACIALTAPSRPAPSDWDQLPLPRTDGGLPILVQLPHITLALDPNLQDATTALAQCSGLINTCYTPPIHSLDDCVAAAPPCATPTPWTEATACCPVSCATSYLAARRNGLSPSDALDATLFGSNSCFPL